jgi:hypothetical protein
MVQEKYPGKRSQAMLGSTLARDNRMQIALNNASGEAACLHVLPFHLRLDPHAIFKLFCPYLKKPI